MKKVEKEDFIKDKRNEKKNCRPQQIFISGRTT